VSRGFYSQNADANLKKVKAKLYYSNYGFVICYPTVKGTALRPRSIMTRAFVGGVGFAAAYTDRCVKLEP